MEDPLVDLGTLTVEDPLVDPGTLTVVVTEGPPVGVSGLCVEY